MLQKPHMPHTPLGYAVLRQRFERVETSGVTTVAQVHVAGDVRAPHRHVGGARAVESSPVPRVVREAQAQHEKIVIRTKIGPRRRLAWGSWNPIITVFAVQVLLTLRLTLSRRVVAQQLGVHGGTDSPLMRGGDAWAAAPKFRSSAVRAIAKTAEQARASLTALASAGAAPRAA